MKRFTFSVLALSLAVPAVATAQNGLTEAELMVRAAAQGVCADGIITSAIYVVESENRVHVTCQTPPAAAGLGLGVGTVAAAVVGVGLTALALGGSTSDTQ